MGTPYLISMFVLFLAAIAPAHTAENSQICSGDVCVNAEVVSSAADMRRGLQGREKLEENSGMLFVFPDDSLHQFWMKGMKFSIDIIWLDESYRAVFVSPDVPPCQAEPCPKYASNQMSRYVLEVPAGFAAKHKIQSGTEFKKR